MAPNLGVGEMSVDVSRSSFLKIVDSTPLGHARSSTNKCNNPEHVRNTIASLANSLDSGRIKKES